MLKIKSKIFAGLMVALFVVTALVASNVKTASADTWAPSSATIIKKGSSSANVMWLQATLNAVQGSNLAVDGKYGPKTTAAIKVFQAAHSSSGKVDGIAGKMTIAALNAAGANGSANANGGCSAGALFNPNTGAPCNNNTPTTVGLPQGCTSTAGYSPVTGVLCSSGSTPQTGAVTAMLSSNNPASGTIVAGQATADLLHVTFTGSGVVNSITLQRGGVSDQSTLTNVYLYDGVQRLTDGYSFNTNGTITMNNLNLAVNGSRTISVKADVYSTTASYDIYLTLTGFTAGTAVNTVSLKGNDMFIASGSTLASAALGCNTVTGSGGVTTAGSCAAGAAISVNSGVSSYTVWRAPISVNTRALFLKAANFRVTGSAQSSALANAKLYIDGVQAGPVAMMSMTNGSNYLSFDMTAAPVSLTTGSHTVEVRADIVGGASYNIVVSLQQASDLMVYDPQVGVNIAVGSTSYTSYQANTAAQISIGAGSSTITVDPSFSSMTNITGGASNAVIARFKVHGYGEDVKVTSLPVTPVLVNACTTGSTYSSAPCNVTTAGATHTQFATGNGLQNVTLYFNGAQVGTQQSWGSGTLTFNLGSQLIIPANSDNTLEVRADLRTSPASTGAADPTATSGATYSAGTVSANLSAGTAEGWSSHSSITTPAVSGTTLAIQTGLLAVASNAGYSNQSVNPNTAGTKIGSFIVQNQSSSESVRVTSLAIGLDRGDGTTALTSTADVSSCPTVGTCYPALTNFAALRTSETSGSGSQPVQPQASNSFSVDFTLAPGATKTIDVLADTGSATAGIIKTTLAVTAIGTSSNVSVAQNGNGTAVAGQAITLSAGAVTNPPTLITASTTPSQYIAAGCDASNVCGAVDGTKATFNLISTNGSSTVSELKFTVSNSTATSVRVGTVSAPVVSGTAWLQGLNLIVPNGGAGLTIDAYVTYSTVGTTGTASATTSQLALSYVKYSSGGTTSSFSPTVNAPVVTLVGSKPTVAVNTSTNSGLNLSGDQKIGEVTVSADAKGNIKINDIQFAVTATGFTTNPTFTNARLTDGTTTAIPGSSCGQGTAAAASQTIFCEFGTTGNTFTTTTGVANVESNTDFDGYTIAAGTSKTFSLYANVSAANIGTNSASISTSLVAGGFNWDDTASASFVADGTNASPSAGTNQTGSLIYNFPSGSYTLKQ